MSCSYVNKLTWGVAILLVLTVIACTAAYADGEAMPASSTTESLSAVEGAYVEVADEESGEKISLDLRGVDLRDALSALAMEMNANIILLDPKPVKVNFQADNTTARQALELIIQSQELAYLQNGQIIVVGPADKLKKDFFNQMILTRFSLFYIPPSEMKTLLGELGLDMTAITVNTNENAIWVQGTAQALKKVREIIYSVDNMENQVSLEHKTATLTQVSPERAVELLAGVGVELKRYVLLDNRLLVFDTEVLSRWEQVQTMIEQLDIQAANKNKVFVFQLKNIAAGDAADRLEEFGFSEVKTIAYNYDRFGHELMVICPPYLETQLRSALVSMDTTRQATRAPVLKESGENAHTRLSAMRDLLSELSGVPVAQLHISRNLSGDKDNPEYVLWVEETPDKIQLVKDLIDEMGDKKN